MTDGGSATEIDCTNLDRPPAVPSELLTEHIRVEWHRHSQLMHEAFTPHAKLIDGQRMLHHVAFPMHRCFQCPNSSAGTHSSFHGVVIVVLCPLFLVVFQ